jgi:hypothetical protein
LGKGLPCPCTDEGVRLLMLRFYCSHDGMLRCRRSLVVK